MGALIQPTNSWKLPCADMIQLIWFILNRLIIFSNFKLLTILPSPISFYSCQNIIGEKFVNRLRLDLSHSREQNLSTVFHCPFLLTKDVPTWATWTKLIYFARFNKKHFSLENHFLAMKSIHFDLRCYYWTYPVDKKIWWAFFLNQIYFS